uniref:Small integral membrane protein 11 n=2 Tax=Amphiprion ocellaris TaxID=80972 RepID=A0A3Q1CD12_AMPOC
MFRFYWLVAVSPASLLETSINRCPGVAVNKNCDITGAKMINWKALDNVPVLLYILALKTLLLCLAFAGVKIYQSKKAEEALKKEQAEKRRLAQQTQELIDNLKED